MQILFNLINNAVESLEVSDVENKKITVALYRSTMIDSDKSVRLTGGSDLSDKIQIPQSAKSGDSDAIEISIEDNGVGILQEDMVRIFRYGHSTKKSGAGTGLHLAANTAAQLGGILSVTSDGPGLGARFILTIPFNDI